MSMTVWQRMSTSAHRHACGLNECILVQFAVSRNRLATTITMPALLCMYMTSPEKFGFWYSGSATTRGVLNAYLCDIKEFLDSSHVTTSYQPRESFSGNPWSTEYNTSSVCWCTLSLQLDYRTCPAYLRDTVHHGMTLPVHPPTASTHAPFSVPQLGTLFLYIYTTTHQN